MKQRLMSIMVITASLLLVSVGDLTTATSAALQPRIDRVSVDPKSGTASIVECNIQTTASQTPNRAALDFIASRPDLFRLREPSVELQATTEESDELGYTHVRFDQVYQGLPVWGCRTVAHFREAHTLYLLAGQTVPTPKVSTNPTVSVVQAEATALASLTGPINRDQIEVSSELVVYPSDETSHLAWMILINGVRTQPLRWRVFVDAHSGEILLKYNDLHNDGPAVGTGIGVGHVPCTLQTYYRSETGYELYDASRPMYVPSESPSGYIATLNYFSFGDHRIVVDPNGDNVFDDDSSLQAAVSAHFYAGEIYRYYREVHGRNSWDDLGSSFECWILQEHDYNNAFGGPGFMGFGKGDGKTFLPFSGSFDVVAHEFTHGLIETEANLVYIFQSGALNESYCDFMGVMADSANWLLAEQIVLVPPGFLRNFQDPHQGIDPDMFPYGYQPAHMSEYLDTTWDFDNGGVHVNSGIPNKVGYLTAAAIGRYEASRIWYRTLTTYLTPRSDFPFWAAMTIQAAGDLFGFPSSEVTAVTAALEAVGFGLVWVSPARIMSLPAKIGTVADTTLTVTNWFSGSVTVNSVSSKSGSLSILGPVPTTLAQGQSAQYQVSFDATARTECDLGGLTDTIMLTTTSATAPSMLVPVTVDIGYVGKPLSRSSFATSCLTVGAFNVPGLDDFTHKYSGTFGNSLYKASLLLGCVVGDDTLVYMDPLYEVDSTDICFTRRYAAIDTVSTRTLPNGDVVKSFRFATDDGRFRGRIEYQFEPVGTAGCAYFTTDYRIWRNPCDGSAPSQVLAGLFADFNSQSNNYNRSHYDSSRSLIWVTDQGLTNPSALVLLSGRARNLRTMDMIYYFQDGFFPGEAYEELVKTSCSFEDNTDRDWGALLTFGSDALGVGDTAHYRAAFLQSINGIPGLYPILDQIPPVACCEGSTGNVNTTGIVDLSDLSALVSYLTGGGYVLPCAAEANINNTGIVDLSDLSALVSYLTGGGYVLPNCLE